MSHSLLGYVHGRLELPATERLKLAQNKTPAKVRFGDDATFSQCLKTPKEGRLLIATNPEKWTLGINND